MISKDEIRQGLDEVPMESVFNSKTTKPLTHKQKRFVKELVVNKKTKADAYRASYNTTMKPKALGSEACKLSKDPRISLEIEKTQRAIDAMEYRSTGALRALVVQTLTEVLLSDDAKHSDKINASKVIGEITGVDLFKPVMQDTKVVSSKTAKDNILQEIKRLITNQSDDVVDVEALGLLEELAAVAHPPGTPPIEEQESPGDLHSIPLKSSENPLKSPNNPPNNLIKSTSDFSSTKEVQKNETSEFPFKIKELRDDSESSLPPLDDFDGNLGDSHIYGNGPLDKSGGFHP
jgi:hypothetical protein